MTKSNTLRMEPWVVVVALVLTAAAGWMLFQGTMMGSATGGMNQPMMGMNPQMQPQMQQMMGQMSTMLDNTIAQTDTALEIAALATDAANVPSALSHLQRVLDTLQNGDRNLHTHFTQMSAMVEGEQMQGMMGSMPMMETNMPMHHSDMMQMMREIEDNLTSAVNHFGMALDQTTLDELQRHVSEGIHMLELVRGNADTGGLLKMKSSPMMHMHQMGMMSL